MTLSVNGEKIDQAVIEQEIERLKPDHDAAFAQVDEDKRQDQLAQWAKENVIEQALLNQYARQKGPKIESSEIQAVLDQMKQQYESQGQSFGDFTAEETAKISEGIEVQLRVEKVLRDVCKDTPEPTHDQIVEYYMKNEQQFKTPEQIRVAHIVKHINWQCDEAAASQAMAESKKRLDAGELFESLVADYSDCPENGGDLGYITRGKMVEEFEAVVFNLNPGQISDVFRTRFGFHIAKLYDRKEPELQSLEDVQENIGKYLAQQAQQETIDGFLDQLKTDASIEEI